MSRPVMRKNAIAVAILAIGFGMGAVAQTSGGSSGASPSTSATPSTSSTTPGSATAGKSTLDRGDRKFLENAAMGGMAEVELGKLAQQKASNDEVKKFGERMAQDHGKAGDQLKQTASAKGVQLPTALDKKHQKEVDKFSKLAGADFDREYMKHMVSDHKKDVSDFEKAAKSKDGDIKSFASGTLPTLQEHLKLAQTTHDAVKGGKSAAKTATSGTGSMNSGGTGSSSTSSSTSSGGGKY